MEERLESWSARQATSRRAVNSVKSTCRMAARRHREDGARNAEQLAADQQRDDDRHRADADLARHDLRHQHVVLELLLDDEEHDDEDDLVQRDRRRHGDRGNGREDRTDDRDQLADAGDQREHVEERNPEQPESDRGRAADDRAEQQLAAEPGADLDRDVAARRGHAGAVAAPGTAAASLSRRLSASTRM